MKYKIDEVIALILNGSANASDKDFFNNWLKEDDLNKETFERIKTYWEIDQKRLEIPNKEEVKRKIWVKAHESNTTKSRNLIRFIYRVAAIILFALTFTFLIKSYLIDSNHNINSVSFNVVEKKNLAGAKSKINLPDGSMVNLNAESSIRYVEGFKDSTRWVELEGEAYFDVAKDQEKPFIVKSGGIVTTALGTAFNINSYQDKSTIDISLVEGRVEIKSLFNDLPDNRIYLSPGQFASFQNDQLIENGVFEAISTLGWKDGIIVFKNADYATVVKRLERWFGVRFKYEGVEPLWNLDAKFNNASLEQILETLSHSEQFEYQLFEDTVKLKLK